MKFGLILSQGKNAVVNALSQGKNIVVNGLSQGKNIVVNGLTTREKVGRGLCASLGQKHNLKPVVFRIGFLAAPFLIAGLPFVPLWVGIGVTAFGYSFMKK